MKSQDISACLLRRSYRLGSRRVYLNEQEGGISWKQDVLGEKVGRPARVETVVLIYVSAIKTPRKWL
jgi:hypothetical protein